MTTKDVLQTFLEIHLTHGLPKTKSLGFAFVGMTSFSVSPRGEAVVGRFESPECNRNIVIEALVLSSGVPEMMAFIEHRNPTFDEFDYTSSTRMTIGRKFSFGTSVSEYDISAWLTEVDNEISGVKKAYAIGTDWEPDQISWDGMK